MMESPASGRDAKGGNPLAGGLRINTSLVPGPHPASVNEAAERWMGA